MHPTDPVADRVDSYLRGELTLVALIWGDDE